MQRYVDWVNGLTTPEDVFRERFIESPVVQPTVIMAKETFLEAGGYHDDGYAEDYHLWLRLAGTGMRYRKVSEKLYQWHDRAGRLTRTHERYDQKKMIHLKALALATEPRVRKYGVVISGAGPIGRALCRELIVLEVEVHGFFEVSPKRVGSVCQGKPIAGIGEFGTRWREAVLLSAVGVAGAREGVRAIAVAADYREGFDFFCCC